MASLLPILDAIEAREYSLAQTLVAQQSTEPLDLHELCSTR